MTQCDTSGNFSSLRRMQPPRKGKLKGHGSQVTQPKALGTELSKRKGERTLNEREERSKQECVCACTHVPVCECACVGIHLQEVGGTMYSCRPGDPWYRGPRRRKTEVNKRTAKQRHCPAEPCSTDEDGKIPKQHEPGTVPQMPCVGCPGSCIGRSPAAADMGKTRNSRVRGALQETRLATHVWAVTVGQRPGTEDHTAGCTWSSLLARCACFSLCS